MHGSSTFLRFRPRLKLAQSRNKRRLNNGNRECRHAGCEAPEPSIGRSESYTPQTAPAEVAVDVKAKQTNKPLSFYLAFLALNMTVLIVSLDANAIPVAIPVSLFATVTAVATATVLKSRAYKR